MGSPGVIFDDDNRIQGQKESFVLLCNVVKPDDVDDPISVGRSSLLCAPLLDLNSRPLRVEEIFTRTQTERLMKIYHIPTFSSMPDFLTMFALNTGRLLKASPFSSPSFFSFKTLTDFHSLGRYSRHPRRGAPSAHQLEPSKYPIYSPNHPRCMLRIYRLRFPEAAGKLLRALSRQATRRS